MASTSQHSTSTSFTHSADFLSYYKNPEMSNIAPQIQGLKTVLTEMRSDMLPYLRDQSRSLTEKKAMLKGYVDRLTRAHESLSAIHRGLVESRASSQKQAEIAWGLVATEVGQMIQRLKRQGDCGTDEAFTYRNGAAENMIGNLEGMCRGNFLVVPQ